MKSRITLVERSDEIMPSYTTKEFLPHHTTESENGLGSYCELTNS